MSKYEHERDEELHVTYCDIIKKYCDTSVSILDIGSSTGHLLYQLKQRGYNNVFGIDPAPACKDQGKKNFNIPIETAELYSFEPKEKFDLLIFAAVFEHLEKLSEAVEKIHQLITDDGYVFISIPDAENFYHNFAEPFGEFSTEHINFFSQQSLYQLMLHFRCIYMKSDGKVIYSLWKKGSILKDSMTKYIEESQKKFERVNKIVEEAPSNLIIWGAGSLTQRLLQTTNLRSKVFKFVDRDHNLIGKKLEGVQIIDPSELSHYPNPILIASFRFKDEMVTFIKEQKLNNPIITFS